MRALIQIFTLKAGADLGRGAVAPPSGIRPPAVPLWYFLRNSKGTRRKNAFFGLFFQRRRKFGQYGAENLANTGSKLRLESSKNQFGRPKKRSTKFSKIF